MVDAKSPREPTRRRAAVAPAEGAANCLPHWVSLRRRVAARSDCSLPREKRRVADRALAGENFPALIVLRAAGCSIDLRVGKSVQIPTNVAILTDLPANAGHRGGR